MSNPSAARKPPDFLVHEDGDSVGVVVVEGIKAGSDLTGWVMAQDRTITVKVLNDVPIGHKLALRTSTSATARSNTASIIGKFVAPIKKGEHVHVHNLKTKRW